MPAAPIAAGAPERDGTAWLEVAAAAALSRFVMVS